MSRRELLKALIQQQEQELEQLRRDARERLANLRRETATRLRLARADLHNLRCRSRTHLKQQLLGLHEREWQKQITEHHWELAASCREVADRQLQDLWVHHRSEFLTGMHSSLPDLNWACIRVTAADVEAAKALFPGILICIDEDLGGGFVAECPERGLVVDSSLSTCLERLWPTLLPQLIKDIAHASQLSYG